jgi:hypothetical protein
MYISKSSCVLMLGLGVHIYVPFAIPLSAETSRPCVPLNFNGSYYLGTL